MKNNPPKLPFFPDIQCVSFDAGYTLVAPNPSFGGILAEVAARRGYSYDPAALTDRFFAAHHKYAQLSRSRGKGMYTCEAQSKNWWDKITIEAYGHSLNTTDAQPLADECYHELSQGTSWKPYPDAVSTLTALNKNGYRLIVMSNWDSRLPGVLDDLGLADFFEKIYYSTAIGAEKPDEPFFRFMLNDMQIPEKHVLHVGDNPIDDLQGASRMGMHGLVVSRDVNIDPVAHVETEFKIESLGNLTDCLSGERLCKTICTDDG